LFHSSITCKSISNTEEQRILDIFNQVAEPENRDAFVFTPMLFKSMLSIKYRKGVSSIGTADENLLPFYYGFHSVFELKKIIHLKAAQLVESGIITMLMEKIDLRNDLGEEPEPIGPQVLTLRHLGPSFIIITVLLGLCVLVFVVECTLKGAKKWFGACLACYIVVKFTRMNKML
jgi:hypothetical protein